MGSWVRVPQAAPAVFRHFRHRQRDSNARPFYSSNHIESTVADFTAGSPGRPPALSAGTIGPLGPLGGPALALITRMKPLARAACVCVVMKPGATVLEPRVATLSNAFPSPPTSDRLDVLAVALRQVWPKDETASFRQMLMEVDEAEWQSKLSRITIRCDRALH